MSVASAAGEPDGGRLVPPPPTLCLVIGAMKSGTTSLFGLLARHPQIAPAKIKEPQYFVHDGRRAAAPKDDHWYLSLYADRDPARQTVGLEASTAYTMLPGLHGAPEAVARFLARWPGTRLKLVYIMRHPVKRIESEFRFSGARHPVKAFLGRARTLRHGIAVSSYATQLAPWVEQFGREALLLLSLEELERDGVAVLERVCRFLDIDAGHRFEDVSNPQNVSWPWPFRHMSRWALFARVWRPIPLPVRTRLKAMARELMVRRRPYLSGADRQRVIATLRPEMERLANDLGFDSSIWDLTKS